MRLSRNDSTPPADVSDRPLEQLGGLAKSPEAGEDLVRGGSSDGEVYDELDVGEAPRAQAGARGVAPRLTRGRFRWGSDGAHYGLAEEVEAASQQVGAGYV